MGPAETYTNIKWALGQASDGDTIIVKDGVYVEDIIVRVSVVLMAENLHGAVIGDGSATLAMISIVQAPTNGVVIDGFKFVDYDRPGIIVGDGNPANGVKNCIIRNNNVQNRRKGIRVAATSTNLKISDNTIKGCSQNGIQHQGVGDNVISGNILEDCGGSGIWLPEQLVGSFTISNNEIRENGGNGIEIERSDVIMEGNIIEGNQIGINTNCGRSNIVVRDSNQIINNTTGIVIECGTTATIENNNISGNLESGIISHGFTSITGNTMESTGGCMHFVKRIKTHGITSTIMESTEMIQVAILIHRSSNAQPYIEEYRHRWPFIGSVRGDWEFSLSQIKDFNIRRPDYIIQQMQALNLLELLP